MRLINTAVSEVVSAPLTGEWQQLRTDFLHSASNSKNPAIDVGQIGGAFIRGAFIRRAFIQGMAWLTTEALRRNDEGKLVTRAPSPYKIPAVNNCPKNIRTSCLKIIIMRETILNTKVVEKPPLLPPFSAFFAIRNAIASVADYKINPLIYVLASCEQVLNAITVIKPLR